MAQEQRQHRFLGRAQQWYDSWPVWQKVHDPGRRTLVKNAVVVAGGVAVVGSGAVGLHALLDEVESNKQSTVERLLAENHFTHIPQHMTVFPQWGDSTHLNSELVDTIQHGEKATATSQYDPSPGQHTTIPTGFTTVALSITEQIIGDQTLHTRSGFIGVSQESADVWVRMVNGPGKVRFFEDDFGEWGKQHILSLADVYTYDPQGQPITDEFKKSNASFDGTPFPSGPSSDLYAYVFIKEKPTVLLSSRRQLFSFFTVESSFKIL